MRYKRIVAPVIALLLAGCVTTGGGSGGPVSGSAGGGGSSQGTVDLARCASPVATAAISMPKGYDQKVLINVGLPADPTPAMRLVAQQSNCFQIVHRDIVMQTMKDERALAESGELRDPQKFGKGQIVSADYTVLVEVLLSDENAGGIGGVLGFVPGMFGAVANVFAAGVKFKEAQVLLTLVNNRSGVQIASAAGQASGTSFGGLGAGFGTSIAAGAGGYMNTNGGKVVMGAMVDAMNQLRPNVMSLAAGS